MEQDIENDGDGMTNHEIIEKSKGLGLKNFKYFMSDELVGKTPDIKECGIVNVDDSTGEGTHQICYWLNNRIKYCFDSFGYFMRYFHYTLLRFYYFCSYFFHFCQRYL